jgi:hypothetical protein
MFQMPVDYKSTVSSLTITSATNDNRLWQTAVVPNDNELQQVTPELTAAH